MPLIDVAGAAFSYGRETIFHGIDFSVNRGEIFCLLGPNGCGKTTLLDCILGTQKLKAGSILLEGKDTAGFRPGQVAHHVAYVPQKHERTFPYSVYEIVKMGRTAHIGLFGSPSQADDDIARHALESFGIAHLGNRPYTQLSGGEGQLVMIARALAQMTPVIIMDEPTAHLDFRHELVIMETIIHLVRDKGISVIMATHFPNHAFYFQNNGAATTVALLHEGSFLAAGIPADVICEEKMQKLYRVHTTLVSYDTHGRRGLKQIIPVSTVNNNGNKHEV
ncbi:MAG: ABC transporter ATP-binding protein [Pseudomonadota bacterium]